MVTFTDAATQELRERIRSRLGEAARCFAEPQERHDGLLVALRQQYPAERWPGCARLLRLAAEWMDEAAVSTIHSWCYRMLREHAFDSGSLFTQNLETDQSELLAEVVRDYWRRNFYGLTAPAAKPWPVATVGRRRWARPCSRCWRGRTPTSATPTRR